MKPENSRQSNPVTSVDRVTYGESVKVNIGDYESREVNLFFSTDVKDDEEFDDAIQRARSHVRKTITTCEKRIRVASQGNVDFDTKSKLMREGF